MLSVQLRRSFPLWTISPRAAWYNFRMESLALPLLAFALGTASGAVFAWMFGGARSLPPAAPTATETRERSFLGITTEEKPATARIISPTKRAATTF